MAHAPELRIQREVCLAVQGGTRYSCSSRRPVTEYKNCRNVALVRVGCANGGHGRKWPPTDNVWLDCAGQQMPPLQDVTHGCRECMTCSAPRPLLPPLPSRKSCTTVGWPGYRGQRLCLPHTRRESKHPSPSVRTQVAKEEAHAVTHISESLNYLYTPDQQALGRPRGAVGKMSCILMPGRLSTGAEVVVRTHSYGKLVGLMSEANRGPSSGSTCWVQPPLLIKFFTTAGHLSSTSSGAPEGAWRVLSSIFKRGS